MSGSAQLSTRIGLTMAALGVLLAVAAALVGAERTEVVRTLVLQANAWDEYQSESMKDRMMTSELVMLDALTPTKSEAESFARAMAKIRAGASTGDNPEVMEAIDLAGRELADVLSPDHSDGLHFVHLIGRYDQERAAAARWAESFEGAVDAHFVSGERYDHAQLLAEMAVVVASIGLLFSSRALWVASLLACIVCVGAVGATWVKTREQVRAADAEVVRREHAYRDLRERLDARGEDEHLLRLIVGEDAAGRFGP